MSPVPQKRLDWVCAPYVFKKSTYIAEVVSFVENTIEIDVCFFTGRAPSYLAAICLYRSGNSNPISRSSLSSSSRSPGSKPSHSMISRALIFHVANRFAANGCYRHSSCNMSKNSSKLFATGEISSLVPGRPSWCQTTIGGLSVAGSAR